MKKTVPIRPFWYTDKPVLPKLVTVITTVDKEGTVNAAPFAFFMQFDVMDTKPRILLGMRKFCHTYRNIEATGEFVINFPPYDYLDDVMEACRFYPEGVNELDFTQFTPIPSQKVTPPSLEECGQIIECTVDNIYTLDKIQGHIIGNVEAILLDEELIDMSRPERAKALDLAITLGDESRRFFYFGRVGDYRKIELKSDPAGEELSAEVKRTMDWEPGALKELEAVPHFVLGMVIEMTEQIIKEEGSSVVTTERFKKLIEEYAPPSVMERLPSD